MNRVFVHPVVLIYKRLFPLTTSLSGRPPMCSKHLFDDGGAVRGGGSWVLAVASLSRVRFGCPLRLSPKPKAVLHWPYLSAPFDASYWFQLLGMEKFLI